MIIKLYTERERLQLQGNEVEAIIAAPGSSNPLFIRLLLEQTKTTESIRSSNPSLLCFTAESWIAKATIVESPIELYRVILRQWNECVMSEVGTLASRDEFIETYHRKSTSSLDKPAQNAISGSSSVILNKRFEKLNNRQRILAASENTTSEIYGTRNEDCLAYRLFFETFGEISTTKQHWLVARHLLSLLAVSRYGLREEDLMHLTRRDISPSAFRKVFNLIKPHLLQIKIDHSMLNELTHRMDCYTFNHNTFRLLVRFGFLQDSKLRLSYCRELANHFEKMDVCQLRIMEFPVQLERCELWPTLTSVLTDIDMFRLWWTSYNRESYFSHWTRLRERSSAFDPVDEFVKSLDRYLHRDSPNSKTLLALLLDLTQFFRQYQARFDHSAVQSVSINRPMAPQWQDFIITIAKQTFTKKTCLVQSDAFQLEEEFSIASVQAGDSYFIQRWLWVQFPLFAIAFAHRFVDCAESKGDTSLSSHKLDATCSKKRESHKLLKEPNGFVCLPAAANTEVAVSDLPKGTEKTNVIFPHAVSDLTPLNSKNLNDGDSNNTDESDLAIDQRAVNYSKDDLEKWSNQLLDIRAKYNKSIFVEKEKLAVLKSLDAQLLDSRATTGQAGHEKDKEEELQQRILSAAKETALGRRLSDYYKVVVRHCETNPARDSNILEKYDVDIVKCKHVVAGIREKIHAVCHENKLLLSKMNGLEQALVEKAHVHRAILRRQRWQNHKQHQLSIKQRSAEATHEKLTYENQSEKKKSEKFQSASSPKSSLTKQISVMQADHQSPYSSDSSGNGSPAQSDAERGLMELLRHAGLNDSNEVHVLWKDLHQHEIQLQEEESKFEKCVHQSRQHLEKLRLDLTRLSLENNDADSPLQCIAKYDVIDDESLDLSRATNRQIIDDTKVIPGTEQTSTTQTQAAYLQTLKLAELQVTKAISVTQRKRQNTLHLRNLLQKLDHGIRHVARIIGVTSPDDTKASILVDHIELAVRMALGEDASVQTSGPAFLQRKKSYRSTGSIATSLHALQLESPESHEYDEEKVRYNIRVSQKKQQTSPYRIMQKPFSTASRAISSSAQVEEEDDTYGEGAFDECRLDREIRKQIKRKTEADKRLNNVNKE
uniref:Uncharacterized protein AlNc14C6G867 n=1 Tax=Albugo laibachii Nc14 TaxID=890382 RepID=F0W198_9STRA|nr:conserved hypothetical protein [Albugo laibachii Nc14]|eukprot:CCA14825.1 conserved hypothetical protein [Albugo laibachii Nc14]